MKKLILILCFLAFSYNCFAEDASLSEVLQWKYGSGARTCQETPGDTSPAPKMVICEWNNSAPQPTEAEIATITQEYLASQDYWVRRFDSKLLLGSLYQAMPPLSALKLAPYTGAIQSMMDWKNFSGIRMMIEGLVSVGTVTPEEQTIIYQCYLMQGIDLTLWAE